MLPNDGDLKLCNCAGCGRELAGDSDANRALYALLRGLHPPGVCDLSQATVAGGGPLPPLVRGRIHGRPYCDACLQPHKAKDNTGRAPRQKVSLPDEDNTEPLT